MENGWTAWRLAAIYDNEKVKFCSNRLECMEEIALLTAPVFTVARQSLGGLTMSGTLWGIGSSTLRPGCNLQETPENLREADIKTLSGVETTAETPYILPQDPQCHSN